MEIFCGDIFSTTGMKVIACDTHFDTRVDDIVVSKRSLHGQLILNHRNVNEIKKAVEDAAGRMELLKNKDGLYDFPLGTIIRYDSSVDKQTCDKCQLLGVLFQKYCYSRRTGNISALGFK